MEVADIHDNLAGVRGRIADAARRANRDPQEIEVVAVTKSIPAHRILDAHELGLRTFGENRVQEARDKIPLVSEGLEARGWEQATWHMVGHLQTNKARWAVALFDMIHSVDSVELAKEISRRSGEMERAVPILLEVNVSDEESKYGFAPDDLAAAVESILPLPHVEPQGLMTIAPWVVEPEQARPYFDELRRLQKQLAQQFPEADWRHLSMGMTDDFEVAIEEGATLLRIGRAIFGERRH